MADEARILHVASAVAEGTVVDWNQAENLASDAQDRKVLNALFIQCRCYRRAVGLNSDRKVGVV